MCPGQINKCGLPMQQKKTVLIIFSFLQKRMMVYSVSVWQPAHPLQAHLHRNPNLLKKVFPLTLLYSKMMMEATICILAGSGAVSFSVGEPVTIKKVKAR